jgi:hypothetical protein
MVNLFNYKSNNDYQRTTAVTDYNSRITRLFSVFFIINLIGYCLTPILFILSGIIASFLAFAMS